MVDGNGQWPSIYSIVVVNTYSTRYARHEGEGSSSGCLTTYAELSNYYHHDFHHRNQLNTYNCQLVKRKNMRLFSSNKEKYVTDLDYAIRAR